MRLFYFYFLLLLAIFGTYSFVFIKCPGVIFSTGIYFIHMVFTCMCHFHSQMLFLNQEDENPKRLELSI